jgi:hypothetical protein
MMENCSAAGSPRYGIRKNMATVEGRLDARCSSSLGGMCTAAEVEGGVRAAGVSGGLQSVVGGTAEGKNRNTADVESQGCGEAARADADWQNQIG